MEETVCYFSQTCRKLADMAGALQVMTLAQGNKYKEEHFIKKQTQELRLKLLGAHGSRGAGAAFDQLILKRGLGCSLFTLTGDMDTETQLSAM